MYKLKHNLVPSICILVQHLYVMEHGGTLASVYGQKDGGTDLCNDLPQWAMA